MLFVACDFCRHYLAAASTSWDTNCSRPPGDLTNLVYIPKAHSKLPTSSVPHHIRKTFWDINHSELTLLSHPRRRRAAPQTNGWSKPLENFHLETRLSVLLCCVLCLALFVSLLVHKWPPKTNPPEESWKWWSWSEAKGTAGGPGAGEMLTTLFVVTLLTLHLLKRFVVRTTPPRDQLRMCSSFFLSLSSEGGNLYSIPQQESCLCVCVRPKAAERKSRAIKS